MKVVAIPRVSLRLLLMGWIIVSGMVALTWFLISCRKGGTHARIAWMQWMSRRFLRLLGCRVCVSGAIPGEGLVACNHLSYVDILVLGSVCPAVFVAKSDVRGWPVFGWLASRSGTIFVSRDNPTEVPAQLAKMERSLREGNPVVLFPEGTSSSGSTVLPFRSSLLESVVRSGKPVTPVAVSYSFHGHGNPGQEIAYWGDHSLFAHLLNLLSKPGFEARIAFGQSRSPEPDRKREVTRLHGEVSELLGQVR